jgi:hypothetical protein
MLSHINCISYPAMCTLVTTTNNPAIHSFNLLPYRPPIHSFIHKLRNTMCNPHQNHKNSLNKVFGPPVSIQINLVSTPHPCPKTTVLLLHVCFRYYKWYQFNSFWKYLYPFPISPTSGMPWGISSCCIQSP